MVRSSRLEEGRAEAVLMSCFVLAFVVKIVSTFSATVQKLCMPSKEQLSSVFSVLIEVKIPMYHSSGKSQWTSSEFLFIQNKIVGKVASTECHHLSGRIVNTELKLLRYSAASPFKHFGVLQGVFVVFKDQRDPFVLQDSLLHKSKLAAKRDNPTLPVAVFSQQFTCNGTGAYTLHYHSHPLVLCEGGIETLRSTGPQQEQHKVAQT